MRGTYGAPSEQSGKRRKGQEPFKHLGAVVVHAHEGEEAAEEMNNDRGQRTARPVDVAEELWGITLLGHGSQASRSAVYGRHTDRKHRHQDDKVHEVVQAVEARVPGREDEGRGVGVVARRGEQVRIVGGDKKTDEEESQDIEPMAHRG